MRPLDFRALAVLDDIPDQWAPLPPGCEPSEPGRELERQGLIEIRQSPAGFAIRRTPLGTSRLDAAERGCDGCA